jgi:transposase
MAFKEDHYIAMFIQEEQKTATAQLEDAYILLQELIKAKEEISSLQVRQKESDHKIEALEKEIERLKEQLQLAQQRHFGKKKESGDIVTNHEATVTEPEKVTVAAHTRKKKQTKKHSGRVLDTSELPRFTINHDLEDANKHCCHCHGILHLIGKDKSEQLEILPQRFYIAEHIRYKYACRHCETITMAPKEPAPIPKSLASASLLTEVIINKYHAHLPLYRQSKMIENFGLLIPDNTLGNWVMQVGWLNGAV